MDLGVLLGDPRLPYAYGADGRIGEDELEGVRQLKAALASLSGFTITYLDEHDRLLDALRARPPRLALNLCDNGYRNRLRQELHVPALLEMFDIPYTGADPVCMSLCTDKALIRAIAASQGIPVPEETFVDLRAERWPLPGRYPSLIKPNATDGSLGIDPDCVVHDEEEARAYLRRLADTLERPQALIQEFLTGDEYTVGIIGNPESGLTVLPPLVIDYSGLDASLPPILPYASKADPASPYWHAPRFQPAALDEATHAQLVDHGTRLFTRLGCRDYARIDFRAGADGVPRLLDANYNPTWNYNGKMAVMAGYAGYSYADLLAMIVEAAMARYGMHYR